jgi:hypothetical protein
MAENPHYRELLRILNECGVEYLIVGGYAVMNTPNRVTQKTSMCGSAIRDGPRHLA